MTADRGAERKHRTYLAGHRAERLACLWLLLKGYRILARRYAVRGGEVDIVASRRGVIAFVEVKARSALAEALIAVTPIKQQRIARATAVWLARNPWAAAMTLRGDLVAVAPWRFPVHQKDALPLHREM